jgi:hypothetical protein
VRVAAKSDAVTAWFTKNLISLFHATQGIPSLEVLGSSNVDCCFTSVKKKVKNVISLNEKPQTILHGSPKSEMFAYCFFYCL